MKLKKNITLILGILVGIFIGTICTYASTIPNAKDIEYTPESEWDVDTVEDALNSLYDGTCGIEE